MKPKEIFRAYLENSLFTNAGMNARQVKRIIEHYDSSVACNQSPEKVFSALMDSYGNEDLGDAVSKAMGLMDNSEVYQKLKKLNSERKIETTPALIVQNEITELNQKISVCSILVDGVDISTAIREKATMKIPKVFEAKASSAVKCKGLDLVINYSNPNTKR